jgi:hypothetical protein
MSADDTQEQSSKSFRSYIHPVVLYLLAAVCWLWVAVDSHIGSQTQLALVALIFLSAQWGLLSPCGYLFWLNIPDTSRRDKLFTNRGANHESETQLQAVSARI